RNRGTLRLSPRCGNCRLSARRGNLRLSPRRGNLRLSLRRGNRRLSPRRGNRRLSPRRGNRRPPFRPESHHPSRRESPLRGSRHPRVRRIGLLMVHVESDQEGQTLAAAFREGLLKSGWTEGRNIRIETRWAGGNLDRARSLATELVALAPNVIVTGGASYVTALLQATRTVPIVFATATDPVGGGLVASLAHPGGNVTGFTLFEYGTSGKWLELLKEITPGLTRAA